MVKSRPRASGTHHPKRFGQHQRHTKPFLKTYLPYLPLLVIILTGLTLGFRGQPKQLNDVLAYATNVTVPSLLDETNTRRAADGQTALNRNAQLDIAAQAKASDMATRNYWSHTTPDGEQPWSFLEQAGYAYQKAGENLAYGFSTSAATVAGWMNSPSHKANLLDGDFNEVGFGYANAQDYQGSGNNTIVVALYGRSQAAAAVQGPAEAITATQAVQGQDATTPGFANARTFRIARIQIITNGQAPWSIGLITLLAAAGIMFIVIKHSLGLRRMIVKGEKFVLKHPLFDVTLLAFIALCIFISRVEGYILSASF